MMMRTPQAAYVMNAPGPVALMTAPDPTKRPAPMTPPIAIICNWRWLSARFSSGASPATSGCPHDRDGCVETGGHVEPPLHPTPQVVREDQGPERSPAAWHGATIRVFRWMTREPGRS